jgi:xanthine permease
VATTETRSEPLYDVDELPPLGKAIPLGIQHVLAMFVGNIAPPLIIAGVIGAATGETAFLVQVALLMAGVSTLLQSLGLGPVGARLPVVQGTSFAFIAVAIPLAQSYGLSAVFGGALVAGGVQILLGMSLRWLRWLFPPLVSGVVVLVIGIGLLPVGITYAAGGAGAEDFGAPVHLALAGFVMLVTIVVNQFTRGFLSAAAVLIGVLAGYVAAIPLGLVDFGPIADASWASVPMPLEFGLSFPVAAVVGMAVVAIASSVETIGDLSAITRGGAGREITHRELSGGVMGDGVGTSLAALFGAMPNTSFSQNVGLVALTGVVSRFVVAIGAAFLVVAGLAPKLGAAVATMPQAVLGGSAIVMFAMVAAAGINMLASVRLTRRNQLVIALSVGFGLGLQAVPEAVAVFHEQVRLVLESGVVPAALLAIVLNQVLPKTFPDEAGRHTAVASPPPSPRPPRA